MRLFLVTCASDQHCGFMLAKRYVARSELSSDIELRWVIVDDGIEPVTLADMPCPVDHIRREPSKHDVDSFRGNLKTAMTFITSESTGRDDYVHVIEDDWFSPDWLRTCTDQMQRGAMLFGETRTRYYNVTNGRFHIFKSNGRAAMSATCFHAALCTSLIDATRSKRTIMYDDMLWRKLAVNRKVLLPESKYVVGIKGLPGKRGLGMGSGLGDKHRLDTDGSLLRQWVGPDYDMYAQFREEGQC